jgi:hypothetical protein
MFVNICAYEANVHVACLSKLLCPDFTGGLCRGFADGDLEACGVVGLSRSRETSAFLIASIISILVTFPRGPGSVVFIT